MDHAANEGWGHPANRYRSQPCERHALPANMAYNLPYWSGGRARPRLAAATHMCGSRPRTVAIFAHIRAPRTGIILIK